MASILRTLPSAFLAVREGMSSNAYFKYLQSIGMGARRSEVLQLYRIVTRIVASSPDEPYRPISQAPSGEHLQPWPTKRATGIRQNVSLIYRDKITGHISSVPWSITSENGVVREAAMAMANDAYSAHAERYNQDLIGAVHTGSYQYVPLPSQ